MADNKSSQRHIDLNNVDVDQLEVEVLIICKNPAAFQQSGTFLSRRGWPTTVVGTLSKAVEIIVKNNPDIIFVSMNHPNPALGKLPKIVGVDGDFTGVFVGFAEGNDVTTVARLQSSPFDYKMQGLPSGPNIERIVRRIVTDRIEAERKKMPPIDPYEQLLAANQAKEKKEGEAESADQSGSSGSTGAYRFSQKKERISFKEIKNVHEKQAEGKAKKISDETKKELLSLGKDSVRGESSMMFLPTKIESDQGADDETIQTSVKADFGSVDVKEEATRFGPASSVTQEGPEEGKGFSLLQQTEKGRSFAISSSGPEAKSFSVMQDREKESSVRIGPPDAKAPKYRALPVTPEQEAKLKMEGSFSHSILQAVEAATQDSEPQSQPRKLNWAEKLVAVPIEFGKTRGFFVFCTSKDEESALEDFAVIYQQKLIQKFLENGVRVKVHERIKLVCDPFNFEIWAQGEAQASFLVAHQGAEVGVAFLKADERLPIATPSNDKEMMKIGVQDINPSEPVPFNAYIFLKRSDKYYLYVRGGRHLSPAQKERLLSHDADDFFIKKGDRKIYEAYVAVAYILATTQKYAVKNSAA